MNKMKKIAKFFDIRGNACCRFFNPYHSEVGITAGVFLPSSAKESYSIRITSLPMMVLNRQKYSIFVAETDWHRSHWSLDTSTTPNAASTWLRISTKERDQVLFPYKAVLFLITIYEVNKWHLSFPIIDSFSYCLKQNFHRKRKTMKHKAFLLIYNWIVDFSVHF